MGIGPGASSPSGTAALKTQTGQVALPAKGGLGGGHGGGFLFCFHFLQLSLVMMCTRAFQSSNRGTVFAWASLRWGPGTAHGWLEEVTRQPPPTPPAGKLQLPAEEGGLEEGPGGLAAIVERDALP